MKIKLIRAYGMASVGDILNPPPGVAHLLIQRGIAEIYNGDEEGNRGAWNKRIAYPPTSPVVQRQGGQRGRK